MDEMYGERKIYFIPDNFIEEGRVLQGRFRLRYLIEGIVMGVITASIALIIILMNPQLSLEVKIVMLIFTGGPALAIGIIGYNGDPISVVIKSALAWSKHKIAMLYNPNPRLLKRDPLLSKINESRPMDEIFESIEAKRRENLEKKVNTSLEEGKDFKFAEDEYVDAYTKRIKKKSVKDQKGKKREKEYLIQNEVKNARKNAPERAFDENEDLYLDDTQDSFEGNLGEFNRFGASASAVNLGSDDLEIDFDDDIEF